MPSQLVYKGFSRDGFLEHRASQAQQLALRRAANR